VVSAAAVSVAVADSAVVDLVAGLAAQAVAAEVSAAAAPVEVGRAKDEFVSIRSTQKLRWLTQ
jgi:hypothetical protein